MSFDIKYITELLTPINHRGIILRCQERIDNAYLEGLPAFIEKRFNEEVAFWELPEATDSHYMLRLFYAMCKYAQSTDGQVQIDGLRSGSFLCYLLGCELGNDHPNPLPAHYYCKACGYSELVEGNCFYLDLPQKVCPRCNKSMQANGYNANVQVMFGTLKSPVVPQLNFSVSKGFFDSTYLIAKDMLERDGKRVAVMTEEDSDGACVPMGVLILDAHQDINELDLKPAKCAKYNECYVYNADVIARNFLQYVIIRERDDMPRLDNTFRAWLNNNRVDAIIDDICASSLLTDKELSLIKRYSPKTYGELLNLLMLAQNQYTMDVHEFISSPEFKKHSVYCRDDYILLNPAEGNDRDSWIKFCNFARRNKFSAILNTFELSPELKYITEHTEYLCTRSQGVKKMLSILYRLAIDR